MTANALLLNCWILSRWPEPMNDFPIQGTAVTLTALLALQTLSVDLKKMNSRDSTSRRLGEQRSRSRGQGREFAEMKRYQPGDDVRLIDWRITARKQAPYVRMMEEDRHSEHLIWMPLTSRQYFGTRRCFKSVLLCHWAAFLIWRFAQMKHPVRLVVEVGPHWQKDLRITNTRQASLACQALTEAHRHLSDQFRSLETLHDTPAPLWRARPNLWILSDFLDNQMQRVERAVNSQPVTSLMCLQGLDPFDRHLPDSGDLPVRHGQLFRLIPGSHPERQQQLQHRLQGLQQQLRSLCHVHQGDLISHHSEEFQWQEVQQWPLYH